MDLKEMQDLADREGKRKSEAFGLDDEKAKMYDSMKLSEEVGELMEEILKNLSLQRKEKMSDISKEHLAEEFADVVLVVFGLAGRFNIDMKKAIENKIKIVKKRNYEK